MGQPSDPPPLDPPPLPSHAPDASNVEKTVWDAKVDTGVSDENLEAVGSSFAPEGDIHLQTPGVSIYALLACFGDDEEQSSSMGAPADFVVGDYRVRPDQVEALRTIFERYGDIASPTSL
ncbi:hypothetical protein HHK36_022662 [Tetracentron sinense]|uniref:Uncharacterized protein n=1 Tax=Tetracentron sinense TaxID=13715 RepID=A0A834YRH6_TETSI|nr:hypothetical protein HHK36_022662 [Tetracentron sinense]